MSTGWLRHSGTESGFIGLDISSGSIKLVEMNVSEFPCELTHFATAQLPAGSIVKNEIKDVAAISQALSGLLVKERIVNKQIVIAVPRSTVIIKMITVDSRLTTSEIESRAWVEANRQFPELIGGIYLDYLVLGTSSNDPNQFNLMLVACRKEHIDPYLEILKQSHLKAHRVDVSTYALSRALSLITKETPEISTCALLNLDLSTSSLVVLHQDNMIYGQDHSFDGERLMIKAKEYLNNLTPETKLIQERAVMLGAGDSPAAVGIEKAIQQSQPGITNQQAVHAENPAYLEILRENLIAQLRHVMHFFYSSHPQLTIQKLILSGDCVTLPKLEHFVQQELGIETHMANPFSKMTLATGVHAPALISTGSDFMLATGLSLPGQDNINLLPWREENRILKKKKFMSMAGGCVMVSALIVVVIHFYMASLISGQEKINAFLQSQISSEQVTLTQLQKKKAEALELKKKIGFLMNLQNKNNRTIHVFDELVKITPSTVSLSHLVSDTDIIVLEGVAQSDLDITLFMQKIAKSHIFATPVLTEINAKNVSDPGEKNFQLKVKIN